MKIQYKKILKYSAAILGVCGLLLISFQWGISRYMYPFVVNELQSKVEDASDDMYRLHFDKLYINIAAKKLRLNNISIRANEELVNQKYAECALPTHNIFDLKIPTLVFTGIDIYDAIWQQHININNIEMNGAAIQLLQIEKRPCHDTKEEIPDSCEVKDGAEIMEELQSFFIGDILVRNATLDYLKVKEGDTIKIAATQKLNAHLSSLEMATPQYMGDTYQDLPIKAGNIEFDINETIVPLPNSKYDLGVGCASFSLGESLLRLNRLQFLPKDGGNENVQSIEIQEVTLNTSDFFNGDYKELMQSEQWTIPAIELNEPKIILTKDSDMPRPEKNWKQTEMKSVDFQKVLTPKLNTFGIESFKINDASLVVLDSKTNEELMSAYPINLSINNFKIDHSLKDQKDKLFYADDFKITSGSFRRKLPNALSTLEMDFISLDMVKETASMKNLTLIPDYDKLEFGHVVGHRAGWTQIQNMDVSMKGLDINSLLSRGSLNVKKILISNPSLEAFLDERLRHPSERILEMPQESLRNLPFNIYIDNIEVKNAAVEYTTYGAVAPKMGRFTMEKLNLNAYNVTNNDLLISKDTKARVKADAYIMGTGFLNLDFEFLLGSEEYGHTLSGSLQKMEMSDLNPILEVVPAKIEEGTIDKISFSAFANETRSRGKLYFHYKDLKLKLKDKDTGKVGAKEDLLSFFADKLFIRNDNPKKGGDFREGIIDFERDDSKSIINYWWKSLLTGIVSTISSKDLIKNDQTSSEVLSKMQEKKKKKARRKERRKQLRNKIQRLLENPFK